MTKFLGPILILLILLSADLGAQRTVGTLLNTPESNPGYTLLASSSSRFTYLIDNCGHKINEWESARQNAFSAYLQPNGDLMRCSFIPGSIFSGGVAGLIERTSWEGEVLWSYEYATETYHQHHDFEVLPNGNVLLLAWEIIPAEEATIAGMTNPNPGGVYAEFVIEVTPIGVDSGEIVWEWHMWDHLIQNADSTKQNFGVISDHPELLNINIGGGVVRDIAHANAIDYNEALDQIMINSRDYGEFWVIDHSTTSAEAASSEGGRWGRGGDLLYRWGNPAAYDRAAPADRQFFGQHDAHWINPEDAMSEIMVYNNGLGRPQGAISTVDILQPEFNEDTSYVLVLDGIFRPEEPTRIIGPLSNGENFFSPRISGAQMQSNGNVLICVGTEGEFIEVDQQDQVVYRYINPVSSVGAVAYNNSFAGFSVFRAYRYDFDYPAFDERDLTPGEVVELNAPDDCDLFDASPTSKIKLLEKVFAYHAINDQQLVIENPSSKSLILRTHHVSGQKIGQYQTFATVEMISTNQLSPGVYFTQISDGSGASLTIKYIVP